MKKRLYSDIYPRMATESFGIKALGTDGVSSAVIWPPEDVDALLFYLPPSFVLTLFLSLSSCLLIRTSHTHTIIDMRFRGYISM